MKKGAISLFLIIGVIGVIIALSFIIVQQQIVSVSPEISELPIAEVQTYVSECIAGIVEPLLYTMSYNGGYLSLAPFLPYDEGFSSDFRNYYYSGERRVPILLDGGNSYLRSRSRLTDILRLYLQDHIEGCYDFDPFLPYQVDSVDDHTVEVLIEETHVGIVVHRPISIVGGRSETIIESVTSFIPLRFGLLHSASSQLVEDLIRDGSLNLLLMCDSYLKQHEGVNIYVDSNPDRYGYSIILSDTLPTVKGNPPLSFSFGIINNELMGECVG